MRSLSLAWQDQTHFLKPPLPEGARIYTVLLYLNSPQEGGETHFPDLNLTVAPKQGRALLWPSVRDSDVETTELFTFHESLPVVTGVKFVANCKFLLFCTVIPVACRRVRVTALVLRVRP